MMNMYFAKNFVGKISSLYHLKNILRWDVETKKLNKITALKCYLCFRVKCCKFISRKLRFEQKLPTEFPSEFVYMINGSDKIKYW